MNETQSRTTESFQIYQKVSEGSKSFPKEISLALTDSFDLAVKQASLKHEGLRDSSPESEEQAATVEHEELGPLSHLLRRLNKSPSPELVGKVAAADQQYLQENSPKVGRVAKISPELRGVLESGKIPTKIILPWYENIDNVFEEFSTENDTEYEAFEDSDFKNMPDYDPLQEYDVYEYSSEAWLEPPDPFGLEQGSSVFCDFANEARPVARDLAKQSVQEKEDRTGDTSLPQTQNKLSHEASSEAPVTETHATGKERLIPTTQIFERICSSKSTPYHDGTSDLSLTPNRETSSLAPSLLIYSIFRS